MKLTKLREFKLPPPIEEGDTVRWLPLYKMGRVAPFGYEKDPDNPEWWKPIPKELFALEKAKEYVKQYSLRTVAEWLVEETGRSISHVGLDKRLKRESDRRRGYRQSHEYAKRLEEAIAQTERLEESIYGRREVTSSSEDS